MFILHLFDVDVIVKTIYYLKEHVLLDFIYTNKKLK
jgi:hypothetical protein